MPTKELPTPTPLPDQASGTDLSGFTKHASLNRTIWQFWRFGLVGCLNTAIDLFALNCLLWLWPTQNITMLLLYNSFAYTLGAVNSFLLNRYWTFQRPGRTNTGEVARFVLTALAGTAYNDLVLWFLNSALHPSYLSPTLWTNIAKIVAIASTVLISFLAMRLWVFVQASPYISQRMPGTQNLRPCCRGCARRIRAHGCMPVKKCASGIFSLAYNRSK